jgi:hypothetical protein
MAIVSERMVSPTAHTYRVEGRAAEIALAHGSLIGGPEHMFLAMLHDGGWPVSVIAPLVDLGRAEAGVLAALASPGYSPPPRPRFLVPDGTVLTRGGEVALEMGDEYIGTEHEFLAILRDRDSVPARVLAELAGLGALEAAVLKAKSTLTPSGPPDGAVVLPADQDLDAPLQRALAEPLPDNTTFAFQSEGEDVWVWVLGPGDTSDLAVTREVLNTALASLGRPVTGGEPA